MVATELLKLAMETDENKSKTAEEDGSYHSAEVEQFIIYNVHSILFLMSQTSYRTHKIISSYELSCPVMGTIFLVYSTYVVFALQPLAILITHKEGGA